MIISDVIPLQKAIPIRNSRGASKPAEQTEPQPQTPSQQGEPALKRPLPRDYRAWDKFDVVCPIEYDERHR